MKSVAIGTLVLIVVVLIIIVLIIYGIAKLKAFMFPHIVYLAVTPVSVPPSYYLSIGKMFVFPSASSAGNPPTVIASQSSASASRIILQADISMVVASARSTPKNLTSINTMSNGILYGMRLGVGGLPPNFAPGGGDVAFYLEKESDSGQTYAIAQPDQIGDKKTLYWNIGSDGKILWSGGMQTFFSVKLELSA